MPRAVPLPPPELKKPELTTWILKLRTITPMFGGSANPREVDPANPVRAASVRGHLRFWWRATAGAQYANAQDLFGHEVEIWGSDSVPGKVSIRILEAAASNPIPCCTYHHPRKGGGTELKTYPYFGDYPGYALFPFQGKARRDKKTREITVVEPPSKCFKEESVSFTLHLSFPNEVKSDVELAVAMWVQFGGIGARTRRGCGSLELIEGSLPRLQDVLKPVVVHRENSLLTRAPIVCLVGTPKESAIKAWKHAVETYKKFRQGKNFARNPGSDPKNPAKLGRSRWPEPDTIREWFPNVGWKHKPGHPVRGFPRADLGLPIVFHFQEEGPQDEDFILEANYAPDSQPNSKLGTRFASPVITKVIVAENGYQPLIAILDSPNVWHAGNLTLRFGEEIQQVTGSLVNLPPEQRGMIPPLGQFGSKTIREALVEFVKSEGYKEVRL
ncbi:type III-B CRISPR module RAMP protein Cmr1 [Meiothermus sp.]|jgi:CRISPR-associated protein Cmr1|uniref:type III-B CRISPR module RAMP protein Cmr1 n=1 Tax=Meiothermus sp. TaxID=1955249 RepID=UPI0021DDBCE1|nr:type III-B CRISPR module RAMP protein Cmr1 [Meiothermus sp.]GIW24902.1 MAG: type III-B CRISPR module RAMP protein Cmr1 [Meiothermus sp.]